MAHHPKPHLPATKSWGRSSEANLQSFLWVPMATVMQGGGRALGLGSNPSPVPQPRGRRARAPRSTVSTWICCPQPGDLRRPMGFSSPWLPDPRNEVTRTLISEACTAKRIGKITFPYSQLDDFRQVVESLVSLFPFDLPWQW